MGVVMSEWKEVKLGSLLNLITKGTTPPNGKGFVDSGINYIKSDAISYDGKVDTTKFVAIDDDTHKKFKRSQLEEFDILFSMAGAYLGKNGIVLKKMLPANTNQALAILRVNRDLALPYYISQFLSQPSMIDYINNMSGQSAQPNINFQEISSIEINLPPLLEQKAIAEVLSSLDDKIDLLHRQNKTLEQMAETLFRQLFVEEAGEDWGEVKLGSVIETTSGGTPSRKKMKFYENGIHNWVKSKELNGSFILETEESITEDALMNSSAKLLPKNSILIAMYGATVGEYAIITKEMTCNQAICALKPNKLYPYTFLFLFIKIMKDEIINMAVGSAQQNISQILIKQLPIISPNDKIIEFNKDTEPMFDKIYRNQTQIRTLEKMRDTLLPKLMSGEIKVSEHDLND